MREFLKFLVIWISQNLSIPFWMVGHVHLMTTVYADIHELIMSLGMNIIVGLGFFLDYNESKKSKNGKKSKRTQKKSRQKKTND